MIKRRIKSKHFSYPFHEGMYVVKNEFDMWKVFSFTVIIAIIVGIFFRVEIFDLITKNDEKEKQIKSLKNKIGSLSDELKTFLASDNQLRRALNLPEISTKIDHHGFGGMRSSYLFDGSDIKVFSERVNRLLKEANSQKKSYQNILKEYKKKKKHFESIPMIKPCKSHYSSGFGLRLHPFYGVIKHHSGIDFPLPMRSPVYSTANGTVETVLSLGGYGKVIIINHGNEYKTLYAHLSEYKVKYGQAVLKGQQIALSGNSGISIGPHLHYEVLKDNMKVDPLQYIFDETFFQRHH